MSEISLTCVLVCVVDDMMFRDRNKE